MKELRCPKCGNVFQVDEADYAFILSQVKNAEFEAEIERRLKEMEARQQAEQALMATQIRKEFESQMNEKDLKLGSKETEIIHLKNKLENIAREKDAEHQLALAEKNKDIDALRVTLDQKDTERQLALAEKDKDIDTLRATLDQEIIHLKNKLENIAREKDAEHQLALAEKDKDIDTLRATLDQEIIHLKNKLENIAREKDAERQLALAEKDKDIDALRATLDQEIIHLKNKLENIAREKDTEHQLALAEKDKTIDALHATLDKEEAKLKIAVMEEQKKSEQAIQQREQNINQLKSDMDLVRYKAQSEIDKLKEHHRSELKIMQDQIDYYKDFKTRMCTKMVGETLEIHCSTLFNQLLRPIMPTVYFEKDNEVADGTKGDFIFRDSVDGVEYLSIMFEMKNEMDTSSTRHKNEDFFKKLDEDRRKKGCEYAVLVSLLEPDSELYNGGIVDVSYRYEKMYVIRPQFFIPLITLLVQTSKKSLDYRRQLIQAQSKEVDVTNFENKLEEFKNKFGRHYELASQKFGEAIKQIDDTIAKLQKVKDSLLGSENNFRLANKDTEELTIRKLTYMNPTMKQKFDEARKNNR